MLVLSQLQTSFNVTVQHVLIHYLATSSSGMALGTNEQNRRQSAHIQRTYLVSARHLQIPNNVIGQDEHVFFLACSPPQIQSD